MQRPQTAHPMYRYSKVLLATLIAAFAVAWLLIVLATRLAGIAPFIDKLAASLFLGLLATVLWLDFWGYATLRGLLAWRTSQWLTWVGVIGLLIVFPVVVAVYLARAVLDLRPARTTGARHATPPTRFRTTPIALGALAGVTLIVLGISTVGAAAMTGIASAQGSSGHGTINSSVHPKVTSTPTHGRGTGKKGHGHRRHG